MEIRIRETEAVVQEREFREYVKVKGAEEGLDITLPDFLAPEMIESYGGDVVLESPMPSTTSFQSVCRDGVVQDTKGNWIKAWKVVDWSQEQIASAMASAKANKNAEINAWRSQANMTSFLHKGKEIACDQLSRSDIDAVAGSIALFGTFPPEFPMAWKTVDNQYIPIPDIDAFKAMYSSMTAAGTANFKKSQQLKLALSQATTMEEINAIRW